MAQPKLTEKRVCGHCGNRGPMVIVGEYREIKHDYNEQAGSFNYGEWYEIVKCQNCEEVELRVHSYHHAFSEEECPTVYKTLYPIAHRIPDGLPKKVKEEYERALKARHGDSNGYGVLLGRVLESVFHDKKAKGKMLGQQLEDMAGRNQLPKEALAFADKLNSLRIVGAHFNVGKLTEKEIPIMEKLTKVILEYVYSAPHIIKQAEKIIKTKKNRNSSNVKSPITPVTATKQIYLPIRQYIITEMPSGDFKEISTEMTNWARRFRDFVKSEQLIRHRKYLMPTYSRL